MDEAEDINIPLPEDCSPAVTSDDLPATPTETSCESDVMNTSLKSTVESPSTDNLLSLNISPVVKTPVLGTQQAKRRLLAFCQSKLSRSAQIKKIYQPKNSTPSNSVDGDNTNDEEETKLYEKRSVKKSKKGLNSAEKAKAVIEEIEQIKKAESDLIDAVSRGLFNSPKTKRSKTRSRSRERKYKRSKHHSSESHSKSNTVENIKYPTSWKEMLKNNYDFDKLKQIRTQTNKNEHSHDDFRKQLLFESPAVFLNPLKYRGLNGEEKTMEFYKVRFTKSLPIISYSDNVQEGASVFSRKQILDYVPGSFRTTLEKLCNNCNVSLCLGELANSKSREWYPKEFSMEERERKSISAPLVNYSDAEENFEETEEAQEDERGREPEKKQDELDADLLTSSPKKSKEIKKKKTSRKNKHRSSAKTSRSKRKSKKLKKKAKKVKTKEKSKRKKDKSNKKSEPEENDESVHDDDKHRGEKCNDDDESNNNSGRKRKTKNETKKKKRTETVDKNKNKREKRSESSKSKSETEVPKKDVDSPKKGGHKDRATAPRKRHSRSKEKVTNKHETSTPKNEKPATAEVSEKEKSPDTDDYHSHWESEDEAISQERPSKHNRSWESDEDIFERSSRWNFVKKERSKSPERSLEMPLNICKPFRRDAKPLPDGIMLQVNSVINTVVANKNIDIEKSTVLEGSKNIEIEKLTVLEASNGDVNEKVKEVNKDENVENRGANKKRKKCRWSENDSAETAIGDAFISNSLTEQFDIVDVKVGEELETSISSSQPNILENEYEEFMKSLTSDISMDESSTVVKKRKKRSSSSSSSSDSDSSSDSSTSSSSSDSSSSERKIEISAVDIDELAKSDLDILPKDVALSKTLIGFTDVPLPVPSPSEKTIPMIPLQLSVASAIIEADDEAAKLLEFDRSKPLNLSSLSLPDKKLLKKSAFEDVDGNDSDENVVEKSEDGIVKTGDLLSDENRAQDIPCKDDVVQSDRVKREDSSGKSSRRRDPSPKRHAELPRRGDSSQRRRDSAQRRRDVSPKRRDVSPRRRDLSPRRRSSPKRSRRRESSHPSQKRRESLERRRDPSPRRRDVSPKRRDVSPKRRRHELSPRRRDSPARRRDSSSTKRRRSASPYRNASPRGDISPRRFDISPRRSASPRHKRRHSPSADLNRSSKSPINSPLDGFKRSVADSTISDDLLPQHNVNDYLDSPIYNSQYYRGAPVSQSPKRLSLDDRINQVLGLEKEAPKPIGTTYDQANYNPQYYQQYEHYNYMHPGAPMYQECKYELPGATTSQQGPVNKVVQVGNVLHVMPAENIPPPPNAPKIVQVGNVLEIVPTATIEIIPPPPPSKEAMSAEDLMKQKNAERRAEHEKRRQARELRRKEKERKRKEKEKRKQMKIKLKTENMIKRALLLESLDEADNNESKDTDEVANAQWPPVPIVITNTALRPAGKGILITHGFSENKVDGSEAVKKSVKFADGVNPGEGTSPSGGEELSSPPPPKATLPKEKRYKKTKITKKIKPKKKKIKVKIVRKTQENDGDDSEEDNLPPPSPPPGSPPPHIFPPRIKTHTINNVHLNYVNTVINTSMGPMQPPPPSTVQNPNYSSAYRPVMPVMMTAPLPRGSLPNAHHLQPPHMHPSLHNPTVMPVPHRLPGITRSRPQK